MDRHGFILVAEDDPDVRAGLTAVLEDAGYTVVAASNGKEALEVMGERLPCVVLLDLMMPVMSGWSVVSAMRADPKLRSIPICIITAVPKQAPAEAECVLEKPVAVPQLLQAVGSYC